MNNTLRCFIAIELPDTIHTIVDNIQKKLSKSQCRIKWVQPQNAHLTLKFLGNVKESQIEQVSKALDKTFCEEKVLLVKLTELGSFPQNRPPRIIWIGLNDENHQIHNWAKKTEEAMKELGFATEGRSFKTHITIGRVKSNKNIKPLTKEIKNYSIRLKEKQHLKYITLFKSTLTPEGPIYKALKQIELKN